MPTFNGAVSIEATDAGFVLGPGGDSLQVGSTSLDVSGGVTFLEFTGSIQVAGDETGEDAIQLDDTASDVFDGHESRWGWS